MSPVQARTGTPGSRPRLVLERGWAVAGRQEPQWREQARGPQHQVNPAASTEKQWERRAAHGTVKARSATYTSGNGVTGLPGVWGTARVHGLVGNRRDPSAPPWSGQGRSYKPMAKSSVAQRESEGVVVPSMGVQQNAPGGKGPCFGRARAEGTGQGMIRSTGSNHPAGRSSSAQVRRLERTLSVAAKRPSRRSRRVSNVIRSGDALRETRWSVVACSRMPHGKTIGKPDAGKSHVRFERGSVETGRLRATPRH